MKLVIRSRVGHAFLYYVIHSTNIHAMLMWTRLVVGDSFWILDEDLNYSQ